MLEQLLADQRQRQDVSLKTYLIYTLVLFTVLFLLVELEFNTLVTVL